MKSKYKVGDYLISGELLIYIDDIKINEATWASKYYFTVIDHKNNLKQKTIRHTTEFDKHFKVRYATEMEILLYG